MSWNQLLKVHQLLGEPQVCYHHEALILLGLLRQMQSIPSSPYPAQHQEKQESRDTASAPAVRALPACLRAPQPQQTCSSLGRCAITGNRAFWVPEGLSRNVIPTGFQLCPAVSAKQGNPAGCGSCGNKEEAGAAQPSASKLCGFS